MEAIAFLLAALVDPIRAVLALVLGAVLKRPGVAFIAGAVAAFAVWAVVGAQPRPHLWVVPLTGGLYGLGGAAIAKGMASRRKARPQDQASVPPE